MTRDEEAREERVDLVKVIETKAMRVHTHSLDLSFNELLDMYRNREIDIAPDFQRLFQWSEGARSRFIESLLLEMPVPPIYVIEEDEGVYTLIDGLQRISSYLHFRGELDAPHLEPPVRHGEKLVLSDCDIVPELNGHTYDDLPTVLQIRLRRAFVRVEIVRKGSDSRLKYHMFKRLNTGGQLLTAQQLRNCTIRLLDPTFNNFILELSENEDFKNCTETLTQDRRLGAYDQELVLRFFALRNYRQEFKHDVADFLTNYMEKVSEPDPDLRLPFDYDSEREAFLRTFSILSKTLGGQAFALANKRRDGLTRGFSVYHFEAFTIGLQKFLDRIDIENDASLRELKEVLLDIKLDPEFIEITTGGGKNSPGPLNDRIEFVSNRLEEVL